MAGKKWSNDETQWLVNNYPKYGARYCSEKLNVSYERVWNKINNFRKNDKYLSFSPFINNSKICSKCKKERSLDNFYKSKKGKCGLHAMCIGCFNARDAERYKNDINFRLFKILRKRFKFICESKSFSKNKEDIFGCSLENFRIHIESQFLPWMTWGNYGKWEVDHIIPVSILEKRGDAINLVFNYRNHQPLHKSENSRKKNNLRIASRNLNSKIKNFGTDDVYKQMLQLLESILKFETIRSG